MKKGFVFMVLIAFTLSGCSQPKGIETQTEVEKVEVVPKINVTMNLENQGNGEFIGETNLPDGTEIMITLTNDNGYSAQDKRSVQDGSFTFGPFSDKGSSLRNGTYNVEITTPTANVQPDSVKKIIGSNAVNLVGKLITNDSVFGNRLEYKESFVIGTTPETDEEVFESTPSDIDIEEIYNYMKTQYDQVTNYGENYVPEVHDPQVANMAASRFGISASEAGQIYIDIEMGKAGY